MGKKKVLIFIVVFSPFSSCTLFPPIFYYSKKGGADWRGGESTRNKRVDHLKKSAFSFHWQTKTFQVNLVRKCTFNLKSHFSSTDVWLKCFDQLYEWRLGRFCSEPRCNQQQFWSLWGLSLLSLLVVPIFLPPLCTVGHWPLFTSWLIFYLAR